MNLKLILSTILLFCFGILAQAQEKTINYEEIQGMLYKVVSEDGNIRIKEQVVKNEDGSYRSLDYYELYNQSGILVFKGNKKTGRWLEFYPTTGYKKIHGAVRDSKKEGRWVYYAPDGKSIVKVEIYLAGVLSKTINY